KQTVIWKVPASLIPVVTYDVTVSGDSLDADTPAEIKRIDQAPIQLLFEVGLNDDINELTIADLAASVEGDHNSPYHLHPETDANGDKTGSYYFYSNKWAVNGDLQSPEDDHVTLSNFHPSVENERYYYIEDSIIYIKSGENYVPYTGATTPVGSTYYYANKMIKATETSDGDGDGYLNAKVEVEYKAISANTLTQKGTNVAQRTADGKWYVPKGNFHQNVAREHIAKTTNRTETLHYSDYPVITNPTDSEEYEITTYLGNNGRLKLTAAQGIKLTKKLSTISEQDYDFTFDIKFADNAIDGKVLDTTKYAENGTETKGTVTVSGDTITVSIKNDETIYITGIPAGTEYTVTEQHHNDWAVNGVTGVTGGNAYTHETAGNGTIAAHVLDSVEFTNKPASHKGDLIVAKHVTLPENITSAIPSDIKFDVTVTLKQGTNDYTGEFEVEGVQPTLSTEVTKSEADGEVKYAASNGTVTFALAHGENAKIIGLPDDVTYTVSEAFAEPEQGETDKLIGFKAKDAHGNYINPTAITNATGTIVSDQTITSVVTNTYNNVTSKTIKLYVSGKKTLNGGIIDSTFNFVLEEYVPATATEEAKWNSVGTSSVTFDKDLQGERNVKSYEILLDKTFSSISDIGTHYLRIREVIPEDANKISGLDYDGTIYTFRVIVT
ncbi:MAG: hypothetical protein IJ339_06590, partial [Oscillospiraceae bacterium]|nr:hypothetical protein [Oscillospiraceae bacterium]